MNCRGDVTGEGDKPRIITFMKRSSASSTYVWVDRARRVVARRRSMKTGGKVELYAIASETTRNASGDEVARSVSRIWGWNEARTACSRADSEAESVSTVRYSWWKRRSWNCAGWKAEMTDRGFCGACRRSSAIIRAMMLSILRVSRGSGAGATDFSTKNGGSGVVAKMVATCAYSCGNDVGGIVLDLRR